MKTARKQQAISETDAKRLLKVPEFRQGLMEGFRRGNEKGVIDGEKKAFNRITQFLTRTLEQLNADGKTLSEAIEYISR